MPIIPAWLQRLATVAPQSLVGKPVLPLQLRTPEGRARLVCILFLLGSLFYLNHIKADRRAWLLDFGPTNGTFQAFNPLRRLHTGQTPFRDFYPYLGIGPTLSSYCALRAAGTDFQSSVRSAEVLAGAIHVIALLILARLCRLSWFWSSAIVAALVLTAARQCPTIEQVYAPRTDSWAVTIHGLFYMTQSAIALRAAAPMLLCLYLVLRPTSSALSHWRHALYDGIPAGLALVWSNDYGLPTFTAFCLLFGLLAPGLSWTARIKRCFMMMLVAGAVAGVVLTIATAGQPWRWLQYNAGVAADQFWYYEGRKVLQWSEIPLPPFVIVGIISIMFLALDLYRRPHALGTRCMLMLLLATLAAAYLSTLGGHIESHYFVAFQRTLTFAVPFALVRMFAAATALVQGWRNLAIRVAATFHAGARRRFLWAVVQIAIAFLAVREVYQTQRQYARMERLPAHTVQVPEMGGSLSEPWSKMVAVARDLRAEPPPPDGQHLLFSTYATSFELIAGTFQPSGHDYIIHALGPRERRRYLELFAALRPRFVTTLRRDTWPWELWVRRMHWDFYRELLRHYDPCERSIYHTIWRERQAPRSFPTVPVMVRTERRAPAEIVLTVELPAAAGLDDGLHYVEIEIEAAGAWRTPRIWNGCWRQRLAVLDPAKTPQSFIDRFALPLERRWHFPILVKPGNSASVLLQLGPEAHSQLELRHLVARYVLPAAEVDDFPLARLRAACVDSGPWRCGVHNKADNVSVVCVSDPSDLRHLRPGQHLCFAHSGRREITRIDFNQIHLAGPPLDPQRDGYPAIIHVEP